MKKIILVIAIALLNLSCSEDLERLPLSTIGEPAFWKTSEDAVAGVNATYNVLADNQMYREFMRHSDALSDNGFSQFSFNYYLEISEGRSYDASSVLPGQIWAKGYEGVVRANTVIEKVAGIEMDPNLKSRILAEAAFLRGLFYFNLTNLYGDVPLILTHQTVEESLVGRNPKALVVDQIIKDLNTAIAGLPVSYAATDLGRVTKGAAIALKSRVYLYNRKYTEAADAAKLVMGMTYSLLPAADFAAQFLPEKENNAQESIFEVQFLGATGSAGVGSGFNGLSGALPNFSDTFNPVKNLVEAFEPGDIRLKATILQPGEEFAGKVYDGSKSPTKLAFRKSIIADANITGDGSANAVVIRFAEVLLNYAEAQNEVAGADASVYDAVNKIRKRAGLANLAAGLTKDQMREAIKKERRLELVLEGHRYFDLLRYGAADMEAAMKRVTDIPALRNYNSRLLLWPVPQVQITINQNLLPQNPGWN
jgi:starch-binding outer membrane protein, SusD/RagB family